MLAIRRERCGVDRIGMSREGAEQMSIIGVPDSYYSVRTGYNALAIRGEFGGPDLICRPRKIE